MSYTRGVYGVGALPSGLATASTASARQAVASSGSPEAVLAAGALEAALSGKAASFRSTVDTGLQTVAAVGAAGACAATGGGVVLAPICGYVGGVVAGTVSRLIFGENKPTCGDNLRAVRDGAARALAPDCKGDKTCESEVQAAAQRYAERKLALCALSDHWSMEPSIRAEASKLGLPVQSWADMTRLATAPAWIAHANNRFASDAGTAILAARMRRWEAEAAQAKRVADAEYDALSTVCPKPGIRVPGTTTPCEKKAASAATLIAAQGYLFATTDGAQGIAATQNTALRNQFFAEVKQDQALAVLASKDLARDEQAAAEDRAALSARVLRGNQMRTVAGLALLAAAALGGVYLYQKGAFR